MARITPARCRRWWGLGVPSVKRSRCRPGMTDEARSAAAGRTYGRREQRRRVAVSGPAGRPRIPRPPSGPTLRGWGGAASSAPATIAGRRPVGGWAPPLSLDGGSYGSSSRSGTPRRAGTRRSRRVAGRTEQGNGVGAQRCLGGSHLGPPIPLRQRRDSTPRWRRPGPYAHPSRPGGRCSRGIRAVERPIEAAHAAHPRLVPAGPGAGRSVRSPAPPRSLPPVAAPGPMYHYPAALRWSQAVSAMPPRRPCFPARPLPPSEPFRRHHHSTMPPRPSRTRRATCARTRMRTMTGSPRGSARQQATAP
jgi:hypothetical protein